MDHPRAETVSRNDVVGSMKRILACYIIMSLIAVGAVGFAIFFRTVASVGTVDRNHEAFQEILTRELGDAIIRSEQANLSTMLLLLIVTNALWLGFGVYVLLRYKHQSILPPQK